MNDQGLRRVLLRELTDLYVQKTSHSPEEERHFTELALRLIEHVDVAERARLGARLAAYPGAPLIVLRRLAEPAPDGQRAMDASQSTGHLPRIEETRPADIRSQTLGETFFAASPPERRLILLNLDLSPVAPARLMVASDAATRIERAVLMRQRGQFAVLIGDMLAVSPACAERIAGDMSGEAVLAALKALALPSPAVQRILLFLNPAIGLSADIYFSLVRLYEEIGEIAARRLVAIWRMDSATPQHQPFLAENIPTRARDFARHDARPAPERPTAPPPSRRQQTD